MKQIISIIAVAMMGVFSVSAFAAETEITEKTLQVTKCEKPIGKIALGKVTCKAASCSNPKTPTASFLQQIASLTGQPAYEGIGQGIGDMLISALKQTACFEVLERESLEELKQEMALIGKKVELEAADFLIGGAVTSLTMETTNTNLGLGIIPILSAVDIKKTKAIVGMDIRIIDVNYGKVTFTKSYEANNQKSGLGIGAGAIWHGVGFGGIFSQLKGTALEEVIRDVVVRATVDIVNTRNVLKAQVHQTPAMPTTDSQVLTTTSPMIRELPNNLQSQINP
jgi:curli biogenesis system outer membrane secretion channel CsgG